MKVLFRDDQMVQGSFQDTQQAVWTSASRWCNITGNVGGSEGLVQSCLWLWSALSFSFLNDPSCDRNGYNRILEGVVICQQEKTSEQICVCRCRSVSYVPGEAVKGKVP